MASTSGVHPSQTPDWNNLKVLHRNTLPPRSHFHVYSTEEDALTYHVAKSRAYSLNGTWKFHLANSPFEAPEGFEKPAFDTSSWHDIPVPGMWQLYGFGKGPHYTNVDFPVPVDPPNVPFTDNETGSYFRRFTVPSDLQGCQVRLRFDGVDSAFHVWVNGEEIGYSQGSRNPSEFDITKVVKLEKENTLAVRVYKWCDATYIEDQDQWWLSGIFRDVSLVGFPTGQRIEDLHVHTLLDAEYVDAELKVIVNTFGPGKIDLKLLDAEKEVVATATVLSETGRLAFNVPIKNPQKWTAETPYLYHLVLSFNGAQSMAQRIGFRQVEMKDGLIKVNGKRIVFKGANRHEHHPRFGRAVPFEFLKRDLQIMKSHNINAIRTSHQPNDPRLCDLADEMGFWIMDEADLECHGFESIEDAAMEPEERKLPFRERQRLTRNKAAEWTTNNPEWEEAYVGRAKQLVCRDKVHPSVIIWSLGNEAFFGRNHVAMYNWIKSFDPTRPVHYEADIDATTMDMYSRMYPPIESIVEFAEDESNKKPLVLCEYIHAMGTGPGNIKEYIDAFYNYPKLQGGFVWEWANHGLLTKDKETGDAFYGYGGDFGDIPNDGTFVMDGVLDSQHNPRSALIEYKKAIEPVQLLTTTPNKATFINRYDFITLDHLEATWTAIDEDGPREEPGTLTVPSGVGPGHTAELDLPNISGLRSESFLNISFRLKNATPHLPAGHEVATAQIPFSTTPIALTKPSSSSNNLEISVPSPNTLHVSSTTSTWTFNTLTGSLNSWKKSSTELISSPPILDFWRAPTDNDIPQDGADWKERLLHLANPHTRKTSWDQPSSSSGTFKVAVEQRIAPPVLSWSIDCVITYLFHADGNLSIHVKGEPKGRNLPKTLPRVGFVMEMPGSFGKARWFGRGPGESYRDMKLSQGVGLYSVDDIDELWTETEVPQESSNRTDTRWLELSDSSTHETFTVQFKDLQSEGARKEFDFQASHYRTRDVEAASHPYKLRKMKREDVVLRLDAMHHGLGSGSCGPKTREEYALKMGLFEFEVMMG